MSETRFAVNVGDLAGLPTLAMVLAPVIRNRIAVEVSKADIAGFALVLECPPALGQDIIAAIRQRYERRDCRCYELTGEQVRGI